MSKTILNALMQQRATVGSSGFCRRVPEVSAGERDFWRRAVAEERERLDLSQTSCSCSGRRDAH
jgi:hypothetical protein